MERVTRELEQTSERLEEAEKLNQRYQKELESVEGLHHKVNGKAPKFWDARNLCCNLPKIQTKRPIIKGYFVKIMQIE